MSEKYGKTVEEQAAHDVSVCRNIVREIMNFGVSQGQLIKLIQLLALEVEDREAMVRIAQAAKESLPRDIQLIPPAEDTQEEPKPKPAKKIIV